MTTTPTSPAASQQAAVDAALLVLKSMGLSPADLIDLSEIHHRALTLIDIEIGRIDSPRA